MGIPETTKASLGPHTTKPQVMLLKVDFLELLLYYTSSFDFQRLKKTTSVTTRVQNTTRYVIDGVSNHWNDPFYFHNNTKTTHTTRRRMSTIAQKRFDPPRGSTNTYWIDG